MRSRNPSSIRTFVCTIYLHVRTSQSYLYLVLPHKQPVIATTSEVRLPEDNTVVLAFRLVQLDTNPPPRGETGHPHVPAVCGKRGPPDLDERIHSTISELKASSQKRELHADKNR